MKDSKADFAALLAASGMDYRRGFNPGEEVRATVVSTKGHYVVIDVGAKDEGVVPKEEFILEDGTLRAQEGERVKVWFVGMRQGNLLFTARNKATGRGDAALQQAFEAGTPIDGLVKGEVKGGYEVEVAGQRAFCPYSQMDLHRGKEPAEYIGTKQTFLISEYGEDDRGSNLIVSRRALLERERDAKKGALLAELAEGQVREGVVTRVMDFGVFVDLGGAEGLVPTRELSWDRGAKAEDLAKPGDTVEVLVQRFDPVTERISLSLRALRQNPWEAFVAQYRVGDVLNTKIVRITTFGAFAQLAPGVDGLLSNGRLAALAKGRRIASAHEVVEEGQTLEVKIESIDADEHKIALTPPRTTPTATPPPGSAPTAPRTPAWGTTPSRGSTFDRPHQPPLRRARPHPPALLGGRRAARTRRPLPRRPPHGPARPRGRGRSAGPRPGHAARRALPRLPRHAPAPRGRLAPGAGRGLHAALAHGLGDACGDAPPAARGALVRPRRAGVVPAVRPARG